MVIKEFCFGKLEDFFLPSSWVLTMCPPNILRPVGRLIAFSGVSAPGEIFICSGIKESNPMEVLFFGVIIRLSSGSISKRTGLRPSRSGPSFWVWNTVMWGLSLSWPAVILSLWPLCFLWWRCWCMDASGLGGIMTLSLKTSMAELRPVSVLSVIVTKSRRRNEPKYQHKATILGVEKI